MKRIETVGPVGGPMHAFTDDTDTVIAASIEDANAVWNEWAGTGGDHDPRAWEQVPDDHPETIHCDEKGCPATPGDDGVSPVTRTAGEWVRLHGRGFLCTTEW